MIVILAIIPPTDWYNLASHDSKWKLKHCAANVVYLTVKLAEYLNILYRYSEYIFPIPEFGKECDKVKTNPVSK